MDVCYEYEDEDEEASLLEFGILHAVMHDTCCTCTPLTSISVALTTHCIL